MILSQSQGHGLKSWYQCQPIFFSINISLISRRY